MRKFLLLFIIVLFCSVKASFSQAPNLAAFHLMDSLSIDTNQTPENYFKVMDSVIVNLYPDDSSEGSSRNQYRRFKQFYKSRMPANSGNTNLFRAYAEALEAAITLDNYNCGDEETFRGKWTNIGPKDLDDHQNGGYVTDVWVDPTDDTKRIIATEGGGVWKWNNTDTKWENISDNIHHVGTIGIISMAVNPLNPDDIYIATQPRGAYRDGAIYGMGVWHTTDGGDNWYKETSLPDADFFYGTELKFSPYLVNSQPYIILTSVNRIFAKLGNGNWQLLATISGTNFGPVTNLNEIEFASDIVGTFFLASNWGRGGNFTTGVWQIDFNTTSGAISGSPANVIDLNCNNMTLSTALHGTLIGDNISQYYSLEYVGGGKFFIGLLPLYNTYNNITNYIGPPDWEMIVIEWNLSTPASCTTIINGITNLQGGQCAMQLEVATSNPNIMFLGKTQANIIYKESNVWKWKAISNYLADHSEIHPDIRKIYIQFSQNNVLKPGYDDVVYWCTDGGLSKTTLHDIGEIVTANNFTLDPLESDCRMAENMNDMGLYTADILDVDVEPGKGIGAAAYHNGFYVYNKSTDIWGGKIDGDGISVKFDKRVSNETDFRLIYHFNLKGDYYENPYNVQQTTVASGGLHEPEYTDAHYPMEFSGDYLHIGNRKAWYSYPNGFGIDPPGPPMGVFYWNPFMTLANADLVSDVECHAFTVTKANPEVAYFVNNKSKVQWVIGRGEYDIGISDWTWNTDITPDEVKDPNDGIVVTDLVVDPQDEDRIFVSLGGVNNQNNAGVNRVLGSIDGGDNWTDMSTGLTQLPVNCLVYQEGSDDIIYAGCDDGVYYWNKPTLCWVKMNFNMPNCVVERLVIDHCSGKLIAGTYGRGIWEGDLYIPNNTPGISHSIISDETWTGDKRIEGSIKVESGKTLTIYGTMTSQTTINMPKWGIIYVEKGAKLIIDGATITNGCGDMWTGIYVDADETLHQGSIGGGYYNQGYCEIKNGAIIENSENGVANHTTKLGGGIIIADKSTFRNNRRSAEFIKYQNFNPSNNILKEDASQFTNCLFEVNNDFSNLHIFKYFVSAWGIDGVKFYGCDFKNNQTNTSAREKAFYSIDASYRILPLCLSNASPCVSWKQCTFEGLDYGIDASGYSGVHDIQCDMSLFTANQYGIKVSAANAPILTRNVFDVGTVTNTNLIATGVPDLNTTNPYGINLYYNRHFIVEENNFTGIPFVAKANRAFGSWIEFSPDNNQIYKNTFTELAYANVAYGLNTYQDLFGTDYGLKYYCNHQSNNLIDNIIFNDQLGWGFSEGIHPIQGSLTVPAGNTFSHTSAFLKSDIHYTASNSIDYYYNNAANEIPLYFTPALVIPISTNFTNSCRSNFSNGSYSGMADGERNASKAMYTAIEEEYLTLLYNYNALIDGGNTNTLLNSIVNTWSDNAWTLRSQMLSRSPDLSETVLRTLATEDVLPTPMLLEVLAANPQATRDRKFLDFLRDEIPHPLAEYMIDIIKASWSASSYRKTLETQISEKGELRSTVCNLVIQNMLRDSVHNEYDSIAIWIDKLQTLSSRYFLAEYYVSKNNFNDAISVLEAVPQFFSLSEGDLNELSAYTTLIQFKEKLFTDTISIDRLDSTRIMTLDSIARAFPKTLAGVRASNALCYFYDICTPFYSQVDTLSNLRPSIKNKLLPHHHSVILYPNPAKDFIICKYNFANNLEAKELVISDLTGNQLYYAKLENADGQHIWDTRNVGNGNYIYTVVTTSGEKFSGKITIAR